MGSLEEGGELPARPAGGGPLRPLQVHVSPTGAWRLSLGSRADPRLSDLRPVHTSPLTRRLNRGEVPASESRRLSSAGRGRHRTNAAGGSHGAPRKAEAGGAEGQATYGLTPAAWTTSDPKTHPMVMRIASEA
jgi:hypothetical protein